MPAITAQPIEVVSCRLVRTDGTIVGEFRHAAINLCPGVGRNRTRPFDRQELPDAAPVVKFEGALTLQYRDSSIGLFVRESYERRKFDGGREIGHLCRDYVMIQIGHGFVCAADAKHCTIGENANGRGELCAIVTTSASIKWNVDDPEVFDFLATTFDVREAKRIIAAKPREIHTARTTDVEGMIGMIRIERGEVEVRPEKFDTSIPLIVASFYESSKLVIDGWHRIAKANRLLIEVLPIVILTEEETLAIMRGAGKRSLARKARIREKIKP